MPRFRLKKRGVAAPAPSADLLLGINSHDSYYGTHGIVEQDLRFGDHAYSMPSGTEIPVAKVDANGWPTSLVGADTKCRFIFANPEVAGAVAVVFTAGAASAVSAYNCTINSSNVAAGTANVTPADTQPTDTGWGLDFTPGSGIPKIISAIPSNDAGPYSPNFETHIADITVSGGPIRTMKRSGVEGNEGVTVSSTAGAFPAAVITTTNRSTLNSGDWRSNTGSGGGRPNDGFPMEADIAMAVAAGRPLWRCVPWNASNGYYDAVADLGAAAAIANGLTIYWEVSNEVWNSSYPVYNQARYEAQAFGTRGSALISMDDGVSVGAAAERYVEKTIEVMDRILARYVAAGADLSKLKRVAAIQNGVTTGADYWAPKHLDYAPVGKTALKNHIDVLATAPYLVNEIGEPNTSTDANALISTGYDLIDGVVDVCYAGAVTAAAARGIDTAAYEYGQSLYINDTTTRNAVQKGSAMYALMMHMFARTAAVDPGAPICNFCLPHPDFSNQSFGILEYSGQAESASTPKYTAAKDFADGKRKLIALNGTLSAVHGAAVNTVLGTLKRRTPGSTITLQSNPGTAVSITNASAQILQFKIATAAAFTSAGTVNITVRETDARDATGFLDTAVSIAVS